jgi:hypothetical protein
MSTMTIAEYRAARRKPLKHSNQITRVGELKFRSKREALRYKDLRLLEQGGVIRSLTLQPRFPLHIGDELITTYVADFRYLEAGKVVVEDCKGHRTREYLIKRRLMKALLGIEVRET